jgi:uncharacterized membrane protein
MNETNERIENKIFDAIKSGEVKMRPRWYFLLRNTLGVVAIVIILLIVVYLASFIIFVLHQDGAWFVPVFGLSGWFALFSALPWMLILLSALFVVMLAFLAKRYQFGYQWPTLYSVLGAIFLIAAVSVLFIQTSFYDEFFSSSIAQDVPFLGMYYPGFGTLEPNDVHRGIIILTDVKGFVLQDNAGNISNVFVGPSTTVPFGSVFQTGDSAVVFGDRSSTGTIYAVGVEKVK